MSARCAAVQRSLIFLVASIVIASPLAAQALKTGDIILLRSHSGLYLSADAANQKLSLSPDTGGSSQWKYSHRNDGPALISRYGTFISMRAPIPIHAPQISGDPLFGLAPIVFRDQPGEHGWFYTHVAPANGDTVLMCSDNRSGLSEWNGTVATMSCGNGGPFGNPVAWKVTIVSNPDPNRQPVQKPMYEKGRYYFKTPVTNGYLQFDFPQRSNPDGSGYYLPSAVTHRPNLPPGGQQPLITGSSMDNLLLYGAPIWINWPYPGGFWIMQPLAGGTYTTTEVFGPPTTKYIEGVIRTGALGFVAETQWRVVDPAGLHKAGDRVPLGARICLQSAGGFASVNPTQTDLRLADACAANQTWITEAP
jgi:hypothetical protein